MNDLQRPIDMKKGNLKKDELLASFSELYWLKPYDIPWDAINAFNIYKKIGKDDVLLDFGCGDGTYSALMFGARLPIEYDRFCGAKPKHQAILSNQEGDVYNSSELVPTLFKKPERRINTGLDVKERHLKVAKTLNLYDQLVLGSFEENDLESTTFDKVYSVFSFYWADDIVKATNNVRRVLKKNGEFIVNVPSEHLHEMHLTKKLAEQNINQGHVGKYFDMLDGNRRILTTRYSRSKSEWTKYFGNHGFDVLDVIPTVNKLLFILQDISQRPFLPALINHFNNKVTKERRILLKRYLCEKVYPEFLKQFYEGIEGNPGVEHAYYLFHLKKR